MSIINVVIDGATTVSVYQTDEDELPEVASKLFKKEEQAVFLNQSFAVIGRVWESDEGWNWYIES